MAYTTTLSIVRTTGIGVDVQNELLGTGDNSEDSFDLDNGNVIASSYTVSYGASNSNNLTALTETTHYTLDKDAGLLLLTAGGITELSTNLLYISYTHSPKASDTLLNTYLSAAELEVDKMTGNYWGTEKSTTNFFDWEWEQRYPTTDEPYIRDHDSYEELKLLNRGVNSITGFFVLSQNQSIINAQRYDSVGTAYTDVTSSINASGGTGFQPFADTTAANDYLYIGSSRKFLAIHTLLYTNGVTGGTNTIEYYNGSSWVAISATESATGVLDFEAGGKLSWGSLQDWQKTTVNSSSSLYFVRIVANSTYSTEALINMVYLDQDSTIERDIPLYQLSFSSDGRIIITTRLPNGKRNIRVDYRHGYSSVPADVQELTDLVVALRVFASITGGSFDDATSFTLGRKTVGIGEVYVNVRETVNQFQKRIDALLPRVGESLFAC